MARAITSALIASLAACATTGEGRIYLEPSIKPGAVTLHRVAIVPNRLPVSLQDPEKWRRYNFELLRTAFQRRGMEVVDYDITVKLFEKSGLPMEDTKSSRDKWADLAEQLGVDAVVLPYYGTFASVDGSILIGHHFVSVATLQVYLAGQNDFFSRIDLGGDSSYTTGFATLFGVIGGLTSAVLGAVASGVASSGSTSGASAAGVLGIVGAAVGGGLSLVGTIVDLAAGSGSADDHWQEAFTAGVEEGMEPFFRTVGAEGSAVQSSRQPPPKMTPTPQPPKPSTSSAWGAVKPQSASPPPRQEPPPPPPPLSPEPSPIRSLTPDSQVIRPLDSGASPIRALPPSGATSGGIRPLASGFSLIVGGADATPDVRRACEQVVRESGIALVDGGSISATVTLSDGHAKLDIATPRHGSVLHRELPASVVDALCRQIPTELKRAEEKEAQ